MYKSEVWGNSFKISNQVCKQNDLDSVEKLLWCLEIPVTVFCVKSHCPSPGATPGPQYENRNQLWSTRELYNVFILTMTPSIITTFASMYHMWFKALRDTNHIHLNWNVMQRLIPFYDIISSYMIKRCMLAVLTWRWNLITAQGHWTNIMSSNTIKLAMNEHQHLLI